MVWEYQYIFPHLINLVFKQEKRQRDLTTQIELGQQSVQSLEVGTSSKYCDNQIRFICRYLSHLID
jgi:hypothetical protein